MTLKRTIMIVEEEARQAKDIRSRLEKLGYEVASIFSSGKEALNIILKIEPDLVLMDIRPESPMDAIEAGNRIYADYFIPTLFLVAYNDIKKLEQAVLIAPFGYVIKPFSDRDLDIAIKMALNRNEIEDERRFLEETVVQTNLLLHALIESPLDIIIYALDKKLNYTVFNRAYKHLMQKTQNIDVIIGMNALKVISSAKMRTKARSTYERALQGERFIHIESYGIEPDRLFYENAYSPLKDSEGNIVGLTLFARNITAIKKNEAELIEARQAAEDANRAKSIFLANMSHEIRTPLHSVIGFADILDAVTTDKKKKSYIESIRSSGKNLLIIINDLLDMATIEAGKMEMTYEPSNPHVIFNEIRQFFAQQAAEKQIEFVMHINANFPESMMIDQTRLRQVLINLVGNAVKFTPPKGWIILTAHKPDGQPDNDRADLIITVADTGVGIAPQHLDNIFEIFRKPCNQNAGVSEGAGLGLAITKRLIEMMNGVITLESEVNKGSTFKITLHDVPIIASILKDKTAPLYVSEGSVPASHSSERRTVLVVDDHAVNRITIKKYLRKDNFTVLEAKNGQEAVAFAGQYKPDLILMDIRMPVMDGYEAVHKIKADHKLKHIPIIALTAYEMQSEKDRILRSGFDAYLLKPVQWSELITTISRCITGSEKETPQPDKESENDDAVNLAPETVQKFPEILNILQNELTVSWNLACRHKSFDAIEQFAKDTKAIGEKYSLDMLTKYGNDLLVSVDLFDIEQIEKTLNAFSELIGKIENLTS